MREQVRAPSPVADGDEIALYVSKRKLLLPVLGTIVSVAAGVVLFGIAVDEPANRLSMLLGALFMVLTGATLCGFTFARLFSSQPLLAATKEGLIVDPAMFRPGFIKWSEIDALVTYRDLIQTRLRIELADPLPVLAQLRGLRRWQRVLFRFLKGNLRTSGAVLTADGMLPISMDDFLTLLEQRFHRELAHHGIHVVKRHG